MESTHIFCRFEKPRLRSYRIHNGVAYEARRTTFGMSYESADDLTPIRNDEGEIISYHGILSLKSKEARIIIKMLNE